MANTPNQPSKIRTKNWVEINDNAWEIISPTVKLNLKLQSSLCDRNDAYILVTRNATVVGVGAIAAARTTDIEKK